MSYDEYGRAYYRSDQLADLLYENPDLDFSNAMVVDPIGYLTGIDIYWVPWPKVNLYTPSMDSIEEFDRKQQSNWYMPEQYLTMDIVKWLIDQCHGSAQLQRVAQELLIYQDRGLIDLLRYLKYLVDVMDQNNIVRGVGRGSSVASYVLYLLGVHKIDSLYWDLDIEEFLKPEIQDK